MKTSVMILLGVLLSVLCCVGCTEHHSLATGDTRAGSVTIHVAWPDASTRVIPEGTQSIKITLVSQSALFDNQEKVLVYPTATCRFDKVMPVQWLLRAAAYAAKDGTGTPLATGQQMISVDPVVTNAVALTLDPLVKLDHVTIAPTSLSVKENETQTLVVSPYDQSNNLILLTGSHASWQTSNWQVATVTASGISVDVKGVKAGECTMTVTVTKDGISKQATAAVTVSEPAQIGEMVWVAGGTFTMGSPDGVGNADQHPAHQVTVSSFWIDKYEVTVGQYLDFCTATGHALPPFPEPQLNNQGVLSNFSWTGKTGWSDASLQQHPIVNVTWDDAKAYADWAGKTLPTEAQWEYAARGSLGKNYPWGGTATMDFPYNGWDVARCATSENSYYENKSTWPVGSFWGGESWCGARDMAGNVNEWCADLYADDYYSHSPAVDPTGPTSSTIGTRVERGGGWGDTGDQASRGACRHNSFPTSYYFEDGFRCASNKPGP